MKTTYLREELKIFVVNDKVTQALLEEKDTSNNTEEYKSPGLASEYHFRRRQDIGH